MSDALPTTGSVYCFRTTPYSEFAPQVTDRYATLKVLGSNELLVVVAVLDSIWSKPPSLNDVRACNILREHRFAHTGKLAVWGVNAEWWELSDLDDMTPLGALSLCAEEVQFASKIFNHLSGSAFSTLRYANYAAEGEMALGQ